MNPAPILPITTRTRVVHWMGKAVFVEIDDDGWFGRRTFRGHQ